MYAQDLEDSPSRQLLIEDLKCVLYRNRADLFAIIFNDVRFRNTAVAIDLAGMALYVERNPLPGVPTLIPEWHIHTGFTDLVTAGIDYASDGFPLCPKPDGYQCQQAMRRAYGEARSLRQPVAAVA